MKHRNKLWKKIMAVGLWAVILWSGSESLVYAAEKEEALVEFPVSQIFHTGDGKKEPDGTFEYEMTALEEEMPMPQGSINGRYPFSLKNMEEKKIGPISYSHGGLYRYQVKQRIFQEKEYYTYDETIYIVEVYVKNKAQGLTAEIVILNEEGSKCETIEFVNQYTEPKEVPIQKPEISGNVKTADASHKEGYTALLLLSFAAGLTALLGKKIKE